MCFACDTVLISYSCLGKFDIDILRSNRSTIGRNRHYWTRSKKIQIWNCDFTMKNNPSNADFMFDHMKSELDGNARDVAMVRGDGVGKQQPRCAFTGCTSAPHEDNTPHHDEGNVVVLREMH